MTCFLLATLNDRRIRVRVKTSDTRCSSDNQQQAAAWLAGKGEEGSWDSTLFIMAISIQYPHQHHWWSSLLDPEVLHTYRPVEAAEGRTAHNNIWNGVNGMVSNSWFPYGWDYSTDSIPAITMSCPPSAASIGTDVDPSSTLSLGIDDWPHTPAQR